MDAQTIIIDTVIIGQIFKEHISFVHWTSRVKGTSRMQQAAGLVCPAAAGSTQNPLQNHEIDPLPSYRVLNIQKFINGTCVWL
jgi:hypothetical protein